MPQNAYGFFGTCFLLAECRKKVFCVFIFLVTDGIIMISEKMLALGKKSSAIREIFEYGKKRKAVIGEENVFDFSLGNPSVCPPPVVNETICKLVNEADPVSLHGYTSAGSAVP